MLIRLGNVLFVLGILLGGGWAIIAFAIFSGDGVEPPGLFIASALGLVPIGAGWALRYILAGRQ